MGQLKFLYITQGDVNWYNQFGKQFGATEKAIQEPMRKRWQSTRYDPGQTPERVHQMSYTGLACMC